MNKTPSKFILLSAAAGFAALGTVAAQAAAEQLARPAPADQEANPGERPAPNKARPAPARPQTVSPPAMRPAPPVYPARPVTQQRPQVVPPGPSQQRPQVLPVRPVSQQRPQVLPPGPPPQQRPQDQGWTGGGPRPKPTVNWAGNAWRHGTWQPQGSYWHENWVGYPRIMLYSKSKYRGRGLYLYTSEPDLRRWGFNNDANSVRVSGLWKLCTKPYFRGRCEYVRYSRSRLSRVDMKDNISSVQYLGR